MTRPKRKVAALQTRRLVAIGSCVAFFLMIMAISATTKFQSVNPLAGPSTNVETTVPAANENFASDSSSTDIPLSESMTSPVEDIQTETPATNPQEDDRQIVQAVVTSPPKQATVTTQKPTSTTQPRYEDHDHEDEDHEDEDEYEYESEDD